MHNHTYEHLCTYKRAYIYIYIYIYALYSGCCFVYAGVRMLGEMTYMDSEASMFR